MKGSYEIVVKNRRIQYKFTINRNFTILKGDSATGKTTLIDMIFAFQRNGEKSGIQLTCKKPCVVLNEVNWLLNLSQISDSIVFIETNRKRVREIVENDDGKIGLLYKIAMDEKKLNAQKTAPIIM